MSAWMVTDTHLSALVQEAVVRGIVPPADADGLWCRMKWENHYALHCRYGDELIWDDSTEVPCARTSVEAPLDPWAVLKGISCWGYQCAEFDGWDQTAAHITMNGLGDVLRLELGLVDDDQHYRSEYDRAPWGIDMWGDVIAQRVP